MSDLHFPKRGLQALVLLSLAALLSCGPTGEGDPGEEIDTDRQAIIYPCTSSSTWVLYWYSNFNHTTETGRWYCCFGALTKYGIASNYYFQQSYPYCGGSPE